MSLLQGFAIVHEAHVVRQLLPERTEAKGGKKATYLVKSGFLLEVLGINHCKKRHVPYKMQGLGNKSQTIRIRERNILYYFYIHKRQYYLLYVGLKSCTLCKHNKTKIRFFVGNTSFNCLKELFESGHCTYKRAAHSCGQR